MTTLPKLACNLPPIHLSTLRSPGVGRSVLRGYLSLQQWTPVSPWRAHLMFCLRHPLDAGVRQARGEPTVAIWRKSLNVRTPMGNRRAPAVAAIKPATRFEEERSWVWEAEPGVWPGQWDSRVQSKPPCFGVGVVINPHGALANPDLSK